MHSIIIAILALLTLTATPAAVATPIADADEVSNTEMVTRQDPPPAASDGVVVEGLSAGADEHSAPFEDPIERHLAANPRSSTLVALDIPWEPGDEVSANAEAPEPEDTPEPEVVQDVGGQLSEYQQDPAPVDTPEVTYMPVDAGDPARSSIVDLALAQVGKPYVWAASGPEAFDCSGLVQWVFGQHGVGLPRTSGAQGASGYQVAYADALPGDLVVWGSSHIAIYLGDGMIVHASTPSSGVKVSPLYGSYYFSRVL